LSFGYFQYKVSLWYKCIAVSLIGVKKDVEMEINKKAQLTQREARDSLGI